jgi:molybdopterin/thiamine biosynthesis adenylyltransferase
MPHIGPAAQKRLGQARVVSIGAGGVKSPMLYYLVAAGVGHLTIIDFDRVELSNLNRQILYTEADLGRLKAEAARDRLRQLNSEINVHAIDARVDANNINDLLSGYEVIIEGGDSLAGRLLCNTYCIRSRTPMVHTSAQYGYGYVLTTLPGETACFLCAFPDLPAGDSGCVPVFGVATGIAGALGAGEVIKLITGSGDPITNGYLTFSVFSGRHDFVPTPRDPICQACADTNTPSSTPGEATSARGDRAPQDRRAPAQPS